MFRVIPAEEFLQTFASDRSHMLTPEGHWMSPPPTYPPIKTKGIDTNTKGQWDWKRVLVLNTCIYLRSRSRYSKRTELWNLGIRYELFQWFFNNISLDKYSVFKLNFKIKRGFVLWKNFRSIRVIYNCCVALYRVLIEHTCRSYRVRSVYITL